MLIFFLNLRQNTDITMNIFDAYRYIGVLFIGMTVDNDMTPQSSP